MLRPTALISLLSLIVAVYSQTPVIGGSCKLGTADVQIGGKQTQFFLKCETASDSADGEGVWVVKSRAASSASTQPTSTVPSENTQNQQRPPMRSHQNPNICEQNLSARDGDSCSVSATCLQANGDYRPEYLQCDQTTLRWVKKSCQESYVFNFEQQTCIVPKRMNNLSPNTRSLDFTNNSFPSSNTNCSSCPLGSVCEDGQCKLMRRSTLCADGASPTGRCPCTSGTVCTAQGVCCPPSLLSSCALSCSNARPCPSDMQCSSTQCCEHRKHRHPPNLSVQPASIFTGDSSIFDQVKPESGPAFRVTKEQSSYNSLDLGVDLELATVSSASLGDNSNTATTAASGGALSLVGSCRGTNAVCATDSDCPESFICESQCCRLTKCPHGQPVRFACSSNYQCSAGETCLFGGCCPSISSSTKDAAIVAPANYEEETYSGVAVNRHVVSSSMMPSFGPSDVCERDSRVEHCSLLNPCPSSSECLFGECCRLSLARCSNGLMALSLPTSCLTNDECPLASLCQYGRCCPLEDAEEHQSDETAALDTNILDTSFNGAIIDGGLSISKKSRCLVSPSCSSLSLCPPRFTCSVNRKCCRLDVKCPDGTVPETVCDPSELCPSSAHSCISLEKHRVCCPTGQSPSSGLVCTFSSCSNSNPCSTGTCNNGYCCSSGGSQSSGAIIETASTPSTVNKSTEISKTDSNSTDELLKGDDWPIGPPGYGFPAHLADLDSVLVPASGDGSTCAGGYQSSLVCSAGGECPPGLFCDPQLQLCCPLILPLTDANNPKKARRPVRQDVSPEPNTSFRSYPTSNCCNMQQSSGSGCSGGCAQQAPQIITIPSCPGGGYSNGQCSSGYCSPGYQCVSGSCCPSYQAPQPSVRVFTCPSGGSAVGACISGSCATGYSCVQNSCCPSTTTQNPFVCPDGTQAAGGCVNGQCGNGYTCSNGLCCAGTSTSVRCLDGSEAVGACIPSCQGNACGGSTIAYYCGSGYTCTTGNICCPVNSCPNGGEPLGPTINGLCPTGYTVQGSLCCSATCPDGSAGGPSINGQCPTGTTLTNGVCCAGTTTVDCPADMSTGPCDGGCQLGYGCDTAGENCCPLVDYTDPNNQIGPALDGGLCPAGYVPVYNIPGQTDTENGVCVDLQSIPGICDPTVQSGPCNDGQCQTGYTCFTAAQVCCPPTTAFRKLRPGAKVRPSVQRPVYGRPLNSYMPTRSLSCPDGSIAGGACMNGLCGVGHECVEGLCCPPSSQQKTDLKSMCPNGQTAVSGCFSNGSCGTGFECVASLSLCCPPGGNNPVPQLPISNTVRPIGGRCQQDSECVGHSDGLSLCHAGVCQCSPIAYSQGIACVRRKALRMMMNDSPVDDATAVEKNIVPAV